MRILSKIFVLFTLTFLYGCASGVSIINNNEIYVGMSKSQLRNVHLKTYMGDDPFISGSFSNFDFTKNNEINFWS
jgi:hypothetical protein